MIKARKGMQFSLTSGRTLYLDSVVIETEYAHLDVGQYTASELPLLIRRRTMDCQDEAWFDGGPIHFMLGGDFPENQAAGRGALVSALLWSDAIGCGSDFSELLVVFFVEWTADVSIERSMQEELRDLDWDKLAADRCARV